MKRQMIAKTPIDSAYKVYSDSVSSILSDVESLTDEIVQITQAPIVTLSEARDILLNSKRSQEKHCDKRCIDCVFLDVHERNGKTGFYCQSNNTEVNPWLECSKQVPVGNSEKIYVVEKPKERVKKQVKKKRKFRWRRFNDLSTNEKIEVANGIVLCICGLLIYATYAF